MDGPSLRRFSGMQRKAAYAVFALSSVLALGFAMGWNPPTAKVHSFTEASDYDPVKESGCTDSGEGCHGPETEYTDFNAYHPDAECTTCHEYQGVGCIPCHAPKEHECVLCHDGSKDGIPDRVKLTDPYPRGHYRETTHTAVSTDMDREVRAAEGGEASAKCGDCHSKDLREAHTAVPIVPGSEYGPDIGCGECHNDVRSRGMAEVLSDWKGRRCEDCHAIGTSSAMHGASVADSVEATGSAGCGSSGPGCHESADIHALHPDSPEGCSGSAERGEPGCHDLEVESHEPTATSCGADAGVCHAGYPAADLGHEHDDEVHSPGTDDPAADTSAFGIPCGRCHLMAPDGTSLIDEHALPSSARSRVPDDVCRNCHDDPAALEAIEDDWETRDASGACEACHGREDLDAAHEADLDAVHTAEGEGCANSGPGCHPVTSISDISEPTVEGGLHEGCLRCHDRSASDGNRPFRPAADSCGEGRDCHDVSGQYDPEDAVHDGAAGLVDGADGDHHTAGRRQAADAFVDPATGLATDCDACHSMRLGTEHGRPNAGFPESGTCRRCHNDGLASAGVVKGGWEARDGRQACEACHDGSASERAHRRVGDVHEATQFALDGTPSIDACVRSGCHGSPDLRELHVRFGCTARGCHAPSGDIRGRVIKGCGGLDEVTRCHAGYSATSGHKDLDALHAAVERGVDGTPTEGECAKSGCHPYSDVRELHEEKGCTIPGCHIGEGPDLMSCGGGDGAEACHTGYWSRNHFVDHSADRTGTAGDVTYGPGANEGCFGCHQTSLIYEHMRELENGTLEGGGVNSCRVCHYEEDDPGTNEHAAAGAVLDAIASGDVRCVACHASGSAGDGTNAVASPHKAVSTADPLPAGYVWADPLTEWRAAFDSTTGGGHNVLPAGAVGASSGKDFPLTGFEIGGVWYDWAPVPNSGATAWLRTELFPGATTPEAIASITIRCDDCHMMPEDARGPHGASVRVYIDPEYSQTEYANPTTFASQWAATGTDRVICFKCHSLSSAGGATPGGHSMHARHATYIHHTYLPTDPEYYGAKCVDCHVRVPHAWKRPRLLARTVETTDGVEPDGPPYVSEDHQGLSGVILIDFNAPADLRSSSCVTGGCYENHTPTRHPEASDVPDAQYWP